MSKLYRSGFLLMTLTPDRDDRRWKTGRGDRKKGFFAKMLTSGVDKGDSDTEYFKQYRRALLDAAVIGVDAKNDATQDR